MVRKKELMMRRKFFIVGVLLSITIQAVCLEPSLEERQGQELCHFAEKVFTVLHHYGKDQSTDLSSLNHFEGSFSQDIQKISRVVIHSLKEGNTLEEVGDAVSMLGRLIKCSVDDQEYRASTAFTIHRGEITQKVDVMDRLLGEEVPKKGTNFHKLMIESLAEKRYDLALYSYMKIAEDRCKDADIK